MTPYSPEFFATQSGRSLLSARVVLGELFRIFRPHSVLDVGCGVAPWLSAAQELGVTELQGIDGDYVVRKQLLIDPVYFIPADLEQQRLTDVLAPGRRFDLAMCLEVAEHLSFMRAPGLVEDLTSLSDVVLLGAAIPFQGGEHHVNEQWPEYWALMFRKAGFACADFLRPKVWAHADVDWWYAQNTLVFYREDSAAAAILAPYRVPEGCSLALVHPNNYLNQIHKWFHIHRYVAAAEENADLRALLDAYTSDGADLPTLQAVERALANPERTDVFPFTRMEQFVPEEALSALHGRIAALEGEIEVHRHAAPALEAARTSFEQARAMFETEHAALQTAHEVLMTAHDQTRTAYHLLQAEHETLQAAHDELLAERDALLNATRRHSAQMHGIEAQLREVMKLIHAQSVTEEPAARKEALQGRAHRAAEFYYSLYTRPVIGPILGRVRRTAGRLKRAVRR